MEQLAPQVLLPHGLPSIPLPPEHPPASSIFPCSLFAQSPEAFLEE